MPRKPKFRPRITRVKLNPEQAVLTCTCYSEGRLIGLTQPGAYGTYGYTYVVCSNKATGVFDYQDIPGLACSTYSPNQISS